MYKIPDSPTVHDSKEDILDYIEVCCLKKIKTSRQEICSELGVIADDDYGDMPKDVQDLCEQKVDDALGCVEERIRRCGSKAYYPFTLDKRGHCLSHTVKRKKDTHCWVYVYLLLSTRLKMTGNGKHGGIDGCLLLEKVANHVLYKYLGGRSKSFIFGTSKRGGFKTKLNTLCATIEEGILNHKHISKEKDGKLDIYTFIPFSDRGAGKLILFAQCKTGTEWEKSVSQLQPDRFIQKWMCDAPSVPPVRVFCISDIVSTENLQKISIDAGILFDRCRLVDFCHDLPAEILTEIKTWCTAALETVD